MGVLALVVWSLPFYWIGISMTVRRAIDAGLAALIHSIHRRVLDHVKRRSEGNGAGPGNPDRAP
jgi:hypothetical protein